MYNTYNTLLQKNSSLSSGLTKLAQMLNPVNNTSSSGNPLDSGALKYVKDIKAASQGLSKSLSSHSAPSATRVKDMVSSYNELYTAAVNNAADPKAEKLFTKLVNVSKTYSSSLSDIGVAFDKDGRMQIDEEKMAQAAESGKLDTFFTENQGKNYGFTNQLSKLADSVTKNTAQFVSKDVFGKSLTEDFAYTGFGELIKYNYLSSGWVFDSMF